MDKKTNYATSFKVTKFPYSEITCMTCFSIFYVQIILGDDNIWRMLPAWCRKCDGDLK